MSLTLVVVASKQHTVAFYIIQIIGIKANNNGTLYIILKKNLFKLWQNKYFILQWHIFKFDRMGIPIGVAHAIDVATQ